MKSIFAIASGAVLASALSVAGCAMAPTPLQTASSAHRAAAMDAVLEYVQAQKTTGFLVIQDRKVIVEKNWPVPNDAAQFRSWAAYETNKDGALLEDVASQQKSFVSFLIAVAIDKGLIDVTRPVSDYIGPGWSKASREQEAKIRLIDMVTMSSGLTEQFTYAAPAGTTFFYNTPVYAVSKRVLTAAAKQPLETVTQDWLTGPAGMTDTAWRRRPALMADVGNPTGLVTSPRDVARFGQVILDGGKAADGKRMISEAALNAMFARSAANPSYGRLWWLNGAPYAIKPLARRVEGPLIPAAPSDLVAALGALDRKLYVSRSQRLIVVRMGQAAPDKDFDQTLWTKLAPALK